NVVRTLRPEEVRELFLLREALECLAAREFVGRPAADRAALREFVDAQWAAEKKGDVDAFLSADERFHLEVCRQAAMPEAAALLSSLREKMRQAGLGEVAQ